MDRADRLSPEFAIVIALDTIPALNGKVGALQPKKDWQPPFAFYIPTVDTEEQTLEGPSGLQHFECEIHFVAGSHRGLQGLCRAAKRTIYTMQGQCYATDSAIATEGMTAMAVSGSAGVSGPEDTSDAPQDKVLIEAVNMEQRSPDLVEMEVGLYRRMYTLRLDYQTEEVVV